MTFWDMLDGIIISCRIRKVKPELEIYEHLLSEDQLDATDTAFIGDLNENLQAASVAGNQTMRFVSPSQCSQELMDLKCA